MTIASAILAVVGVEIVEVSFENLSERERNILLNLVDFYISSAGPVGSRAIQNKFKMAISSATIRNTLQDLEDLGLVEQPHTSAGRVPTDLGYRVYVDYLLKPDDLTEEQKRTIKQSILREGRGVAEVLGQTVRVLSEITNELGVALAPKFEEGILRNLRLISIAEGRIMVVVIVQSGLARTVILEVEANVSEGEVREMESILNERLSGLSLSEIREGLAGRLADISGHGRLIKLVVDSKDRIWTEDRSDDLRLSGSDLLLSKPEFRDQKTLGKMIRVLEDRKILSEFIAQAQEEGLFITIGGESKIDQIMNCSLVKSTYRIGNVTGTIGIIGPTRLPYARAVSIVEYAARSITEVLSGIDNKEED